MKQRIFSLLLAVCMAASLLAVPTAAADTVRFSDISDRDTAAAVESLRLMGVLDGYGDGSFRPAAQLNRAQFCKMAVYAMNGESELGLYRTVTVFPDVKPSHWAASFINMAAKGKTIISGYPDGKFHPERPVTVGQAVTILLRLLGYKDENVGGVWPDSYMAVGTTIGLTDGVGTNGNAPLTRGQAARLFLNLLRTDKKDGGSYLDDIGRPVEGVVLATSSGGNDGKSLELANGQWYQLASGKTPSGALNGSRGTLLLNKEGTKALTFIPDAVGASRTVTIASCTTTQIVDTSGVKYVLDSKTKTYHGGEETEWGEASSWVHAGTTVTLSLDNAGNVTYVFVGGGTTASAAVIVYEDNSSAGFDALTGGVTNYAIYKNGTPATLKDLRKYDVATYSSATNSIRVCDTRVGVYYESCSPNPKEPATITVLGGLELTVLPTAMESLSKFKPGQQMTLLLTEDGQVAGAVEPGGNATRSNALGIVRDGEVQLLCGTAKLTIGASKAPNAEKYDGQVVRVSSSKADTVTLSRVSGGASGDLDVSARKLGSRNLAENVMIFDGGKDVSLGQLTSGIIKSSQVTYARVNWAGEVDLIVLRNAGGNVIYGRAVIVTGEETKIPVADGEGHEPDDKDWKPTYETQLGRRTLEVFYGNGKSVGPYDAGYASNTGDFVAVTVKDGRYTSVEKLTMLRGVSNSAWSGKTAVTAAGRTYTVPADVVCYNADGQRFVSLSEAHAYADRADLYVQDGVVRAIQVRS